LEDEDMEESETITRMKNKKSSLFKSFKHKLQKTVRTLIIKNIIH
jgi:hypothetical protein